MGPRYLFFIFLLKVVLAIKDEMFNSLQGVRVANAYKRFLTTKHGKTFCTQVCLAESQCNSASFNKMTLSCELSVYHPASIASRLEEADDWILVYKTNGLKDIWTDVFRGTANVGIDVDKTFVGINASNLPVPDPGCYSREIKACNTHIRSSWIDNWTELNIQEVKVEMLKDGETVAFVTFRNRQTDDKVSWYNSENILNSSWIDLPLQPPDYPFLQLERFSQHLGQSFIVAYSGPSSCSIEGWMFVSEVTGYRMCSFEHHSNYPVFIYTTIPTKQSWTLSYGMADAMIISIKA